MTFDFVVADHGTIKLLKPNTEDAKEWVEWHIPANAPWWGKAVAVEHRYIEAVVRGIEGDGLTVAYDLH